MVKKSDQKADKKAVKPVGEVNLSVRKAMRILRLIAAADTGLTLTQIAGGTEESTTVCHRLLHTLVQESMLDKDLDTGRYRLSSSVVQMARSAQHQNPISKRTAHFLAEITRETEDVALLYVKEGEIALCIDRVEGPYPITTTGTQIGTRWPLHCGAGPFAMLANSNDAFVERYLKSPLKQVTPKTIIDPAVIMRQIRKVRAQGYAISDGDLFDHVIAVGAAILSPSGEAIAAISVGAIKSRYDQNRIKKLGERLRDAAQGLSRAF